MRPLLAALIAPALALSSAAAPVPKEKPKTDAVRIVGTWKMVRTSNGEVKGRTVIAEFTKNGKLTLRRSVNKVPGESEQTGTYKVKDGKLEYTFGEGDEAVTATDEIKKLTDDELVVVDPNKVQEEFARVRPKAEERDEK
ncbi:MAG: hypothetical protein C0501_01600 [Isosphaera sp.]|nr:hypothetical protein [Isosphaera sp.]